MHAFAMLRRFAARFVSDTVGVVRFEPSPGGLTRATVVPGALVSLLTATLCAAEPGSQSPRSAFDFDALIERAQALATTAYDDTTDRIDPAWQTLDYDQYRKIEFRRERTLWADRTRFGLQMFHPGFFFDRAIGLHLITDGTPRTLDYDASLFKFHDDSLALTGDTPGYAGFRLQYPLNSANKHDEFAVFLGASYFRLIGRAQHYGSSARGIAINTASPNGEEFPRFRQFWLIEPQPDDTRLTLYALLDGPSLTGAYRFVLRPRTATQVEVDAVLFTRTEIEKLGIAPQTSMFLFGEGQTTRFDDFRPEVHDTDGLMIEASTGEWIWRPLVNREQVQISSFSGQTPRGFGLIQRDRDFDHYLDLEARYETRPSLWVQPLNDWGSGHVELVEIPSTQETNDNIVAYWVSDTPVGANARIHYRYLLSAYLDNAQWPPGAHVTSTRLGTANRPGASDTKPPGSRLFVIDFEGGDLGFLAADQPVRAVVEASAGTIHNPIVQKNTITGGWRLFFDYSPDGELSADLRAYLALYDSILSESWNYLITP